MDGDRGTPPPPSRHGWSGGQVALVAALTLLLGLATGALFAGGGDGRSAPSPASSPGGDTASTGPAPASPSDDAAGPNDDTSEGGGAVVVGNSVYIANYQSNTDKSTEPFDVDDGWEIRWEVDAGTVTIELSDGEGDLLEVIEAEGRGQRAFAEGGTYQLDIDTDGSRYGVVVTDGP